MIPSARFSRGLLGSLTALGSALALQAATAAPALDPPQSAAAQAASPTILKRLPADAEALTFRGENAQRTFRLSLGRNEAARIGVFQIALFNAVSLLPEHSIIKVSINGTSLTALQASSPDKPVVIPVRIPPGLLVPGINTVRVSAALSHRVDCSINATYELWASLDPVQTGFVMPRDAGSVVRSVDDLALEPLAPDGTTRIHIVTPDDPEAASMERMAGLVDALVRRAGLVRPIVDVGPEPGTGAGFDLVIGGATASLQNATVLARTDGLTLARDGTSNRLIVAEEGSHPDTALDQPAASLAAGAPRLSDAPVQQGFRKSFSQLGLPTDVFAGRHYAASIDVNLPPDFLASNDRAQLLLDGGHGGTLAEGSGLVFRVNGTLVSSFALTAGRAERFQHAIVELPLRFFHPGHNDLAIEGLTPSTADAQCDTLTMTREPRLTIAGTSELDFPSFAHLLTVPQIPAAMAATARGAENATHLYLADHDRTALGAGLTALANLAATQERIGTPQVHLGSFGESDPPGLVIAAMPDLPARLGAALAHLTVPAEAADPSASGPAGTSAGEMDAEAAAPAPTAPGEAGASTPLPDRIAGQASSVVEAAEQVLHDHGFFFGGDTPSSGLPVQPGGLVIAAVEPGLEGASRVGIALPQLLRDPAHWLVVTAADNGAIGPALTRLIASGQWSALGGQAASFTPKNGELKLLQPRTVSYVLPDKLVPSDLRPILGGVMSANIPVSVAILLTLMFVLGASTYLVIRRTGVRG